MKVRIKETGLITDVSGVKLKKKCVTPRGEEHLEFTFPIEEVEIIKDDIDWEQRKFDLVKAAMQGLLSTCSPGLLDKNFLAVLSIDYADTVLAEYGKESK